MSYVLSANTPPPIVIHLDSRTGEQLQTGLTTNFLYTLKEPVLVPDHMNLLLSLHTATIPYSFYNVGDHNKTFKFEISGVSGTPLNLDKGNYSANGILNLLKTHLETEATIDTAIITYSRETLKFSFSYTGSASSVKILDTSTARELIGVKVGFPIVFSKSPVVGFLSPNAIDLNDSIHGLYVRQNLATKGTLDTEQGTFSNILARIPITTNAGGIIFFTPSSNSHETMISVPMIQTIGIRLTDDKHRSIDLNGLHFQLSLKIAYIHKETLKPLQPRRYEKTIKIDDKKKSKKK
tara:strand:+ start:2368 stop:3249 length:882 start_codon:yes stop_codon:yes gene_type:complete